MNEENIGQVWAPLAFTPGPSGRYGSLLWRNEVALRAELGNRAYFAADLVINGRS